MRIKSNIFSLPIFFISIATFLSCGDQPCSKARLTYRLIGFTDTEVDTIVLRRYEKNSLVVKDSIVFTPANNIRFARFADTLVMIAYPANALLESAQDYQVFFPGAARSIGVTEIHEDYSYISKNSKTQCMNEITSCKVDGLPAQFYFINGIYLKK